MIYFRRSPNEIILWGPSKIFSKTFTIKSSVFDLRNIPSVRRPPILGHCYLCSSSEYMEWVSNIEKEPVDGKQLIGQWAFIEIFDRMPDEKWYYRINEKYWDVIFCVKHFSEHPGDGWLLSDGHFRDERILPNIDAAIKRLQNVLISIQLPTSPPIPSWVQHLASNTDDRAYDSVKAARAHMVERLRHNPVSPDISKEYAIWFSDLRRVKEVLLLSGLSAETRFGLLNIFQTTSATQSHLAGAESVRDTALSQQILMFGKHGIRQSMRLGSPEMDVDNYERGHHVPLSTDPPDSMAAAPQRRMLDISNDSESGMPQEYSKIVQCRPPRLLALSFTGQLDRINAQALLQALFRDVIVPAFTTHRQVLPLKMDSFGHNYASYNYYSDQYSNEPTLRLSLGKWIGREVIFSILDEARKFVFGGRQMPFTLSRSYSVTPPFELVTTENYDSQMREIAKLYPPIEHLQRFMQADFDVLLMVITKLRGYLETRLSAGDGSSGSDIWQRIKSTLIDHVIESARRKMSGGNVADYFYYYTKVSEMIPIILSFIPLNDLAHLLPTPGRAKKDGIFIMLVQSGMMAIIFALSYLLKWTQDLIPADYSGLEDIPASHTRSYIHDWSKTEAVVNPVLSPIFSGYHPYFEINSLTKYFATEVEKAKAIVLDLREQLSLIINMEELARGLYNALDSVFTELGIRNFVIDITRISAQLHDGYLLSLFAQLSSFASQKNYIITFARSNLKYLCLGMDKYHLGEVWTPSPITDSEKIFLDAHCEGPPFPNEMWDLAQKVRRTSEYVFEHELVSLI